MPAPTLLPALLVLVAVSAPAAGADAAARVLRTVHLMDPGVPAEPAPTSPSQTKFPELPQPPQEQSPENAHKAIEAWTEKFWAQQAQHEKHAAQDLAPHDNVSLLERLIGQQERDSCGIDRRRFPVPHGYLVVLPAGDNFNASKLLDRPHMANWDLVVLYYGSSPGTFNCSLCKAVYAANGPKWRLTYRFTLLEEWQAYRQRYKAILLPDDDLLMDTCTINKLFSVLVAYDLLMAQPSLCPLIWSYTPWAALYQSSANILRFTTFIEIMAPVFQMEFFDSFVRPTLYNAHVGWGLDFVWPFLLKYPRDKIAVVDEVCVVHPYAPNKGGSVYQAEAPYFKKEEEARRFAEYGYFDSEIARRGFWFQAVEVLGAVAKPVRQEGLLETSSKALQLRLGPLFPLLLFGQSCLIVFGCGAVVCLRLRQQMRRRRGQRYNALLANGGV